MAEPRVHVFIGPFGSGKTETAINFALGERRKGKEVSLIDLDIVNPYFRSREARAILGVFGIQVFSSAEGLEEAEHPVLALRHLFPRPQEVGAGEGGPLRGPVLLPGDHPRSFSFRRRSPRLSPVPLRLPMGPPLLVVGKASNQPQTGGRTPHVQGS